MHSFHQSRGRILFEVACAFGISASCVVAWMQTYSTAMLPAAAIAALYGLVHAFDMVRARPSVIEPLTASAAVDPVAAKPVAERRPSLAPPAAVAAEPAPKRKRRSPRQAVAAAPTEPVVVATQPEPVPEVAEASEHVATEVPEAAPAPSVADIAPSQPEYVPATPLFETEPFVRQQRAAFGRRGR